MNKTSGALQQHLRLNAASLTSYDLARDVIAQYFRSRLILGQGGSSSSSTSGPAPMDVGGMNFKGGKGKGRGKGHWNFMKGEGKSNGKRHFGGSSKGKGKGKNFGSKGVKGMAKGKTLSSSVEGGKGPACWTCGKPGHTSRERLRNRVGVVGEATSVPSEQVDGDTSYVGSEDGPWIHDDFSWYVGAVDDFSCSEEDWDESFWYDGEWFQEPWDW